MTGTHSLPRNIITSTRRRERGTLHFLEVIFPHLFKNTAQLPQLKTWILSDHTHLYKMPNTPLTIISDISKPRHKGSSFLFRPAGTESLGLHAATAHPIRRAVKNTEVTLLIANHNWQRRFAANGGKTRRKTEEELPGEPVLRRWRDENKE